MAKAKLTAAAVETLDIVQVCDQVVAGKSLREIAKEAKRSETTMRRWLDSDPTLAAQYARAREERAHGYADEIITLADDVEQDPQRSRLQVDARKWVASKLMPKVYGDRIEVDNKHSLADLSTEQLLERIGRLGASLAASGVLPAAVGAGSSTEARPTSSV